MEICEGKGVIVSGEMESKCLDYEPQGKYYEKNNTRNKT